VHRHPIMVHDGVELILEAVTSLKDEIPLVGLLSRRSAGISCHGGRLDCRLVDRC